MKIDWSLNFGNILTAITIAVSAASLTYSWHQDRLALERARADSVREAAAAAITALDRWQVLNESLYDGLQPTFVEVSEMLAKDFDTTKSRDFMWRATNLEKLRIDNTVLSERIETSYVALLPFFPETRNKYQTALRMLSVAGKENFQEFVLECQDDILSFEGKKTTYYTAQLGNALRQTAEKHRQRLIVESAEISRPAREFLFGIIEQGNRDVLQIGQR